MADVTGAQPHSRAKLQDTDEMAERFYHFGRQGLSYDEIGLRLFCHANTVCTFLKRAPKSRGEFERGKAERRAERQKQAMAGSAPGRRHAALQPGEPCPTCGQIIGEGEVTIVLTPAELADARRRLDELIDRHIAARLGPDHERQQGQDACAIDGGGTGGAEAAG